MGKWECFHLAYYKMNRNNKYTIPNFIGMNKKGYSKEAMAKADIRRSAAKRNMMRIMKKN